MSADIVQWLRGEDDEGCKLHGHRAQEMSIEPESHVRISSFSGTVWTTERASRAKSGQTQGEHDMDEHSSVCR